MKQVSALAHFICRASRATRRLPRQIMPRPCRTSRSVRGCCRSSLPSRRSRQRSAAFGTAFVPLHYVLHDAKGNSIVLEWVGGKLNIYDNTVGVMTNSPTYDWQMTNLRNYVSLSPDNAKPVTVNGVQYAANGQGSGLLGLPGDPTPPSRLVQMMTVWIDF